MAKDNAAVSTGAEFHPPNVQQRVVTKGGPNDEGVRGGEEDDKKKAPIKKVRLMSSESPLRQHCVHWLVSLARRRFWLLRLLMFKNPPIDD